MKRNYPIILFFCLSLTGCGGCSSNGGKPDTSYLDVPGYAMPIIEETEEETEQTETPNTDNTVKIAYTEMLGNTITIPVKINGMGLDMIYDTGASSTMITLAEAKYLYSKGTLTDADIMNIAKFQTANGAIVEGLRINIRNIDIGDKIHLENVEAIVVENQQAPLLLGQSVMKKFREISVDRDNKVVKFFK
jgi:aspartyl protease family protein